jgi:uncharacterized membrane protein YgcG
MRYLFHFLALGLLLAVPVHARQDRSIALERFDAEIRVHTDGRAEVVETLDIEFRGSWNGIFREISLEHRTAQSRRDRLQLEVLAVTDAQGSPLRHESRRAGNRRELQIWVPGAENATRRIVIRYAMTNALRFFDDATYREGGHDELYWNLTGNEWDMPIRNVSARVILPQGVRDLQAWGYTGYLGSTAQDAHVEVAGNEVRVRADRGFEPGEGLTVSVAWAPGVVDRGAAAALAASNRSWIADSWPLAVPVFAFLLGFVAWNRNGREPRRRSIAVAYDPPLGMSPAEVGTLVDHKAEMHDITSTLVDLAVRGYLTIEEVERPGWFGLFSSSDYVFHLKRPRGEWQDLAPHEQRYLEGLFAGVGTRSVPLDTLTNRFHVHLDGIRDAIYGSLLSRGYYRRRPDHAGNGLILLGFFLFMAGIPLMILALVEELPLDWRIVAAGFGGAVLILILFYRRMGARTEPGVRALEQALGFRKFLSRVESDRYRRMVTSPEMFERFLPYAMAFRVESRWARAFDQLYTTPPEWYRGSSNGRFHASDLARGLHRMSGRAGRTMSSSPSSSGSSSGSGGGGSSGGGSGGGGGRGF